MIKTFEDVRGAFSKRASRMTPEQVVYYANFLVRPDILKDFYSSFESNMAATAEFTIVAGQYAYPLPLDYLDVFLPERRTSPVTDESRNDLRKGYSDSSRTVNSSFGARVYWLDSENINFPQKSIDNSDIKPGEVISLDYVKKIPDVEDESDELPFGERMQELMFPIYVHGIQFGYFRDAKKPTDKDAQLSAYETAKVNTFELSS